MSDDLEGEMSDTVIRGCPCGQKFVALSSYHVHMMRHHPEVEP